MLLICEEANYQHSTRETATREKAIISSVLFEYTSHGALIHYFATTSMKKSSFTKQFVIAELKDNNIKNYIGSKCQEWNVNMKKVKDGVLLLIDEGEDDSSVMRGRGTGRFMLHLVQVLCFCRNNSFELSLKSSEESLKFYKQCNFFKGYVQGAHYAELQSMRCECVISLKEDDNMSKYYLTNRHEMEFKKLNNRTLTTSGNICYMNACFQLLSYSFQNLTPPRILTKAMIKKYKYGLFNYPDVVSFDEFSEKDKKMFMRFKRNLETGSLKH